jgi:diamine N-acetyltransferase
MSITIRKGHPQDFTAILSLINEFATFQKTPEKVTVTTAQMLADENLFQCFVAATEDGDIIGFASFFAAYYSWTGKAIYLDDLYIQTAFRKKGIGKMLLDAVVQLAKEQQCKKVRWQVSRWNTEAINFYKQAGALVDETEINCDLILQP